MKKFRKTILKIIISFFVILMFFPSISYAVEEIISEQAEALNISSFIKEGQTYAKEAFPELNISELLNQAVSGKVDNSSIGRGVLNLLGKEVTSAITLLGSILIIIVIHSILKSISENMGNESVSEIAYYIEYILIVTLIMSNFAGIIAMIKESIINLVGLMNSLVPILLALMMATGNIATTTLIQPLILFSVVFIGNTIVGVILPVTLAGTALGIISNMSDKIQINKLATFFKSSVSWFLGFVIVIFVGILSLEGTLTSNVDGLAAKGVKTVASTFIPVVGKALADSADTVLRMYFTIKKCCWNNWYSFFSRNMYTPNY